MLKLFETRENAMRIHYHVRTGNIPGIIEELAACGDIEIRDKQSGYTPLMEAVTSPKAGIETIRFLIEKGADVNAVCESLFPSGMLETPEEQEYLKEFMKENMPPVLESFPGASDVIQKMFDFLDNEKKPKHPDQPKTVANTVLSLALKNHPNLEKIELLIDSGADVQYECSLGYTALTDVAYGSLSYDDDEQIAILQLLIERGVELNTRSEYGEGTLIVLSRNARFKAVRVLLDAGTDPTPLQWSPLMRAIALGTISDVKMELARGADLAFRDSEDRTPWLLSLQTGDLEKAKLIRAECESRAHSLFWGEPNLIHPVEQGDAEMLRWLLETLEMNVNQKDELGDTALMVAASRGNAECVRLLIQAGADIHQKNISGERAVALSKSPEVAKLLIDAGADPNEMDSQTRALITRLPMDEVFHATREEYLATKHLVFGNANPQRMNCPFWETMVTSGCNAWRARTHYEDQERFDGPVWCFQRFGTSINLLPDGRIIEIAGEHEDHYDPDFCIYNDVIVHHTDGSFDIYGYPPEVFPPTDFHSATLVDGYLYLIGSLGYWEARQYGQTPVYRLNIDSLKIEKVQTSGEEPGWIHEHKAILGDNREIVIEGGKVCTRQGDNEVTEELSDRFALHLDSLVWRKISSGGD